VEVTADGSPRGPLAFALWEPPLTEARGEAGARLRRTATAQAADLLGKQAGVGVKEPGPEAIDHQPRFGYGAGNSLDYMPDIPLVYDQDSGVRTIAVPHNPEQRQHHGD